MSKSQNSEKDFLISFWLLRLAWQAFFYSSMVFDVFSLLKQSSKSTRNTSLLFTL